MNTKSVKWTWLMASILVVCYLGWFASQSNDPDYRIAFGVALLVLSFPLGFVLALIIGLVTHQMSNDVTVQWYRTNATPLALCLAGMFIAVGYFQWFFILPKIVRRLRGRRAVYKPRHL